MTQDEYEELLHRDVTVAEEEEREAQEKDHPEESKAKDGEELVKLTEEKRPVGPGPGAKPPRKVPGHRKKKKTDPYAILMAISIGVLAIVVVILIMGFFRRPPQNENPNNPQAPQQQEPMQQQPTQPQTPSTQQQPTQPTQPSQPSAPVGPNGETPGQVGPNGEQPPTAPTGPGM